MTVKEQELSMAVIGKDNALTGSIPELVSAFDQIGANLASLQLNGWDTAPKCKAACWLAHGAKIHPGIFIQNHYSMVVKGKLIVEPTWQYVVAVLESRVRGFQMEVTEDTDAAVTVKMSAPGKATQEYRYTLEDARRQGLLGRDNAWTAGNSREMCYAKAVKRCGRRFSPAALLDLPSENTEIPVEVNGEQVVPTAAIDAALGRARAAQAGPEPKAQENVTDVPYTETPPPAQSRTPKESLKRLADVMQRFYGKLKPEALAEKASIVWNEMQRVKTGVDPQVRYKKGEIGPVEAEQMADYLEARMANPEQQFGGGITREELDDQRRENREMAAALDATTEDEAPPLEVDGPEVDDEESTRMRAYDALGETVARARKLFAPRKFIQESPPGGRRFYFTDMATVTKTGANESVKLRVDKEIVADVPTIDQLNRILTAACDEAERGGR